jgi:hypothetical protein
VPLTPRRKGSHTPWMLPCLSHVCTAAPREMVRRWLVERVRQWLVEKKRKQKLPAVVMVPSKVGRELDEDGAAGVGVEELVAAAEVACKNKQIHMKLRQVTIECFHQGAPNDCSELTRTNLGAYQDQSRSVI